MLSRKLLFVIACLITVIYLYIHLLYSQHTTAITPLTLRNRAVHTVAPPQQWLRSQYLKTLKLLGYSYHPPNRWAWSTVIVLTYYFPRLNVIFTGLPKTGSTHWLNALLVAEGFIEEDANYEIHFIKKNFTIDNFLETPAETRMRDAFSLVVIRNPWTRLVSGYRNKVSPSANNPPYKIIGESIVSQIRGVTDKRKLRYLYPTFEEFIKFIVLKRGVVDRHFKPQYAMMCMPGAVYSAVVPLEYSAVMRSEVSKIIGHELNIRGSYDQLATDPRDEETTRLAREWLSNIDKDIIEQFYKLYQADFLMGNYSNFTEPDFPFPHYP